LVLGGAAALAGTAEALTLERTLYLNFSDVERQTRTGNPTIRNNDSTIQNLNNMFDESILFALQNSRRMMEGVLDSTVSLLENGLMVNAPVHDAQLMNMWHAVTGSVNNDILSYQREIRQIDSQMEQFYIAPRVSADRTVAQLNNVNRQIIWGAESLYMGYHALSRQLEQSNATLKTLDRNIEVMEFRLSLGQITWRTLQTVKNNRSALEQGIKTMESELENLKGQINVLLGRTHDAPLHINVLPDLERDFLDSRDRARDLKSARDNNHLANIAIIDMYDQMRQSGETARTQEAIARNNRDNELRSVELRYENLVKAINDREAQLSLEEAGLSLLQQALAEMELRHRLGRASRLELEQAENDVFIQTIRVESAEAELFNTIRRYEWLIRGLSV